MAPTAAARTVTELPLRIPRPPVMTNVFEMVTPATLPGDSNGSLTHRVMSGARVVIARTTQRDPSLAYQRIACRYLLRLVLPGSPNSSVWASDWDGDAGAASWSLAYAASGAPRLLAGGKPSRLRISMTHSGSWLAVAIARNARVGVDVERLKPRRNLDAMARYLGLITEAGQAGSAEPVPLDDFISRWTLWEACAKLSTSSVLARSNPGFGPLSKAREDAGIKRAGRWCALGVNLRGDAWFSCVLHCRDGASMQIRAVDAKLLAASGAPGTTGQ